MASALALILALASMSGEEYRFTQKAYDDLQFLYNNMHVEFVFCAHGKRRGTTVFVERISLATIYEATPVSVSYNPSSCERKNLIGMGHSHPGNIVCALSLKDVRAVMRSPLPYHFLVCKGGQITCFSKTSVRTQLIDLGIWEEVMR